MTSWQDVHDAIRQSENGAEPCGLANLLFPIIQAQEQQAAALQEIAAQLTALTNFVGRQST